MYLPLSNVARLAMGLTLLSGIEFRLQAETTTLPVGYVKFKVPAGTDTRMSAPLHRTPVFVGNATAISGNEITLSGATFTPGQFVSNGSTQPDTFFIRVATGTAAGAWYSIIANTATSVTVSPSTTQTLSQQGLTPTSGIGEVLIVPHWSLNSLFPNQAGIVPSQNPLAPEGTNIIQFNPAHTGENIWPSIVSIYHDGSSGFLAAGWYNVGSIFAGSVGDLPLAPDEQFVVRNRATSDKSCIFTGRVPTTKQTTELLELTQRNDTPVIQPFPVMLSASRLNLVESGSFKPSTSPFVPDGDLILRFTSPATGMDQAPVTAYMFFNGTGGFLTAGWYDIGDLLNGPLDSSLLFRPGEALMIRKSPGSEQLIPWTIDLPYTP